MTAFVVGDMMTPLAGPIVILLFIVPSVNVLLGIRLSVMILLATGDISLVTDIVPGIVRGPVIGVVAVGAVLVDVVVIGLWVMIPPTVLLTDLVPVLITIRTARPPSPIILEVFRCPYTALPMWVELVIARCRWAT